ncbi:hypothetical protein PMAYCL1PPCAC_26827, partial [Pristionchus mayeri]
METAEEMRQIAAELETEKEKAEREKEDLEREKEQWTKERFEFQRTIEASTRVWVELEQVRLEQERAVEEARKTSDGLQTSLAEANERVEEEKRKARQFKCERDIFDQKCSRLQN